VSGSGDKLGSPNEIEKAKQARTLYKDLGPCTDVEEGEGGRAPKRRGHFGLIVGACWSYPIGTSAITDILLEAVHSGFKLKEYCLVWTSTGITLSV
jgi:hypothetical protein